MKRLATFAFASLALLATQAVSQEGPKSFPEIEAALAKQVTLEFTETPLSTVLAYVQDFSGVPVVLDPDVEEVPCTLRVKDLALGTALRLLLGGSDLDFAVDDGVILVTYRSRVESRSVDVRTYDVEDLLSALEDFPGPDIGLARPEEGVTGATFSTEEATETFDSEMLVEFLTYRVAPGTWGATGLSMNAVGGLLVVSHLPETHAKIESFLAELRENRGRLVAVDARYYALEAGRLQEVLGGDGAGGSGSVFLDATSRRRLAESGELLDEISTLCLNSQRVSASSLGQKTYVQDYDVVIATSACGFDPIVGVFTEGTTLDVRPVLVPGKGTISLDLVFQIVRRAGELQEAPATQGEAVPTPSGGEDAATSQALVGRGGTLQLPRLVTASVKTRVRVPEGRGAAFVGTTPLVPEGHVGVLVVTPRAME
ncbi:MAG: hypothetical protein HY720_24285 [Planctomycetes bacterium]|nr:hypothetical protein [Planctomycetota bacterium]